MELTAGVHGGQLLHLTNRFPNLELANGQSMQVVEQSVNTCKQQLALVKSQLELAHKENDTPFITAMERFVWASQQQLDGVLLEVDRFKAEFPVIARCCLLAGRGGRTARRC